MRYDGPEFDLRAGTCVEHTLKNGDKLYKIRYMILLFYCTKSSVLINYCYGKVYNWYDKIRIIGNDDDYDDDDNDNNTR